MAEIHKKISTCIFFSSNIYVSFLIFGMTLVKTTYDAFNWVTGFAIYLLFVIATLFFMYLGSRE